MPVSISGTNGVTFPDSSLQAAAASPYVLKNRIINGAMTIDQRNAGASVTPANGAYTLDRWGVNQFANASKFSVQQSSTVPTGFNNSLIVTSLSAYSVAVGDIYSIFQRIEGFNVADLGWGTANAQTVTLSFWVRSSLTGTFGGAFQNDAGDRAYPFTYTISAANTWEQKSITITGDTTGTWLKTNGLGLQITFGLGVGSNRSSTAGSWQAGNFGSATGATSVVGTNGATWYLTGVQLEVGTSATPFERRLYGQELALCQRYLPIADSTGGDGYYAGQCSATSAGYIAIPFSVPARDKPTGITLSAAATSYAVTTSLAGQVAPTGIVFTDGGITSGLVNFTGASSLTAGNATLLNVNGNKIFFTGCEL